MSKEDFVDDGNVHLQWEIIEGNCHVHCTVRDWSPSVLKKCYIYFAQLKNFLSSKGYNKMYSVTPNRKFCELFCGECIGRLGEFEVMIWEWTVPTGTK